MTHAQPTDSTHQGVAGTRHHEMRSARLAPLTSELEPQVRAREDATTSRHAA